MGLTLDAKLTYSTHIHNISVHRHKPLQIIKALTATGCGKQKETLMATYKAVMRPALEYASSMWSPFASSTSLTNCKSCRTQHWELPQDAHKTQTYNICMTKPMHDHLQLHASQYKNKKHNIHHIHYTKTQHTQHSKAKTLFLTTAATQQTFPTDPHTVTTTDINKHVPYL